MNTGAREELAIPASYTTPAVLSRPDDECSTTTISVFLSYYCLTSIKHLGKTSINRIQLITRAPGFLAFCVFFSFVLGAQLGPCCSISFAQCLVDPCLAVVLSDLLRFTTSDYPFDIFKPLTIVLSVLLFMASGYPFGIFTLLSVALSILQSTVPDYPLVSSNLCPLHCLSFNLRFLITLQYLQTFVHCIVYPSIYGS